MSRRFGRVVPAAGYLTGAALQATAVTLTAPAATRVLGPAQYGVLVVVLVVAQILAVIQMLGLAGSVTRFAFDDEGSSDLGRATAVMIAGLFASGCLGIALAATSAWWGDVVGGALASDAIALRAALLATASAFVQLAQAHHRAASSVGAYIATIVGWALAAHVAGVLSAAVRDSSAADHLDGMIVATLATAGFSLAAVPGPWTRPTRAMTRAAVRFGVPVVPHSLGLFLILAGDRIVIERVAGQSAAGRYQIAYLVGGAAVAVITALNNHWGPAVYGTGADRRSTALSQSTTAMAVIAGAVGVAAVASAPWLLRLLAGEAFGTDGLSGVVAIVAVSALPYVLYASAMHVVFLRRRTGVLAIITPAVAALNIGLNLLWIDRYGLAGAAAATGVAHAVWALALWCAVRKEGFVELQVRSLLLINAVAIAAIVGLDRSGESPFGIAARSVAIVVSVAVVISKLDLGLTDVAPTDASPTSTDQRGSR